MNKFIDEISQKLTTLIECYYQDKVNFDFYKNETDKTNKEIKEIMSERGWSEFSTDTLVAKKTVQKRESFDEQNLIKELKRLDCSDALDIIEVINWDKIEDMIYNGKLDPTILTPYKHTKEIVTLRITKKKGE